MKVVWLTDFKIGSKIFGGAERTENLIIKEGFKRGHDITVITSEEFNDLTLYLQSNDLFVINNVVRFNMEEIKKVVMNPLTPFITYNHDYNFCTSRNADCELYKCTACEDNKNYVKYNFFKKIFDKSRLNIFLSPLHEEFTRNKYPNLTNEIVIPPSIDKEIFFDVEGSKRKDSSYVYVGNVYAGKGIAEMLDKFEKLRIKIDFYGQMWDERLKERIEKNHNYFGNLPYEKMGDVFRKYKYFLRYTLLKESFGRTTVEAKACGCKVLSQGRFIGADSFDCSDDELIKKCYESPKVFWDKVEEAI